MESYFARLYLDLQARIKELVPAIEWIEQDFGQDTYDKWRPSVAFPAVLIDFPSCQYSHLSDNAQLAKVTVSIRLLVAPFSQSYEGAPIEVIQDALSYFDLEQELCDALHGWHPEGYSQALMRVSAASSNRSDIGLRVRQLSFSTAYKQTRTPLETVAPPKVTISKHLYK